MNVLKRIMRSVDRLLGKSCPTVRMALVGATTSGKTYLLQDIAAALQYRMGYDVTGVPGFMDFDDLRQRTSGPTGSIERSKMFACRTHFAVTLSLAGDDVCRFEFLDIPGECFVPSTLDVFKHIKNELLRHEGANFEVRSWRRDGQTQRTIHFSKPVGSEAAVGESAEHAGGVERYRTDAEVAESLAAQGYTLDKAANRAVSGNYLINHFFEFVTDTALNAIVDAWDLIGPAVSDAVGSEITREAIENIHLRNFYYLYFTYAATDVIFCDKCAMPLSERVVPVADSTSTTIFYDMLSGTLALVSDSQCSPKRWYLAFKGMDSIMPQQLYRALYTRCNGDADVVYSVFVLMLSRAIARRPLPEVDAQSLWQWLTSAVDSPNVDNPDLLKQDILEMVRRVTDQEEAYFNSPDTYVVNSTDHAGRPNAIGDHIMARVYSFASSTHTREQGIVGQATALPPHVYFASTPIDTAFKIYGHASATLFKGATRPVERLCFGSAQLIGDVLGASGVLLPDSCDNKGKLLEYFHGS